MDLNKKKITFQLESDDEKDAVKCSSKKLSSKKMKNNDKTLTQKRKLTAYLSAEQPITKKEVIVNPEELQNESAFIGQNNFDLTDLLKWPDKKINDKLWKIPYCFTNDDYLYNRCENNCENQSQTINRFGEGISDGCLVGLNLPKLFTKEQQVKTREELLKYADDFLDNLANLQRINRVNSNRRGSVFQPQHLLLKTNLSKGCPEKFFFSNLNLPLREWSSELFIGPTSSDELLDLEYRINIVNNISMKDLTCMLYPDLKFNFEFMTESDQRYILAVSKRRRQSLVPPCFESKNLSFRRQSYAGGELWSPDVEKNNQKKIYQQKLALINSNYEFKPNNQPIVSFFSYKDEITLDKNDLYLNPNSKHHVQLFGNELLLIVRKYFNSISSTEIINFILKNRKAKYPNIQALFHFQNRMEKLIATYVLKFDELWRRVDAILFFINIIHQQQQLNNWHSVYILAQCLQSPPLLNLKECWRKIAFHHLDAYSYFQEINEQLNQEKQLELYQKADKCIPIFYDVIEIIKENCGLIIVQLKQHRFHNRWDNLRNDDDTAIWINDEVGSLMKDCLVDVPSGNNNSNEYFTSKQTHSNKTNGNFFQHIISIILTKLLSLKIESKQQISRTNEDKQMIMAKKTKTKLKEKKNKLLKVQMQQEQKEDDDRQGVLIPKMDYNMANSINQRQFDGKNNTNNYNNLIISQCSSVNNWKIGTKCSMPSGRQFWSIVEFHKLKKLDKEIVKQQIVRTLVAFQRKTFFVFEQRNETIKDFILNSQCHSMNVCMQRSRSITKKSNHSKQLTTGGGGGNGQKFAKNDLFKDTNSNVDNDYQNKINKTGECNQSTVVNNQQINCRSLLTTNQDQQPIECPESNNQLNHLNLKAIDQDNTIGNTNMEKKVKTRRVKFEE